MNIGIVGAGHMGSAIIKGLLGAEVVIPGELYVKGGSGKSAENLQKNYKFKLISDYKPFKDCTIIFIATGAKIAINVIRELVPYIAQNTIIVSVASGHTIAEMQMIIDTKGYAVHAIPNVPVSVNAGVIGAVYGEMPEKEKVAVSTVLSSLGKVEEINENLFNIFGTVAGCSPAFIDIFMEALSDGAVREGMQRALSYEVIAQTLIGTAKLAMETKEHPGALKDSVTSPGGSTIKGVEALEKNNFRYAVINAIKHANE